MAGAGASGAGLVGLPNAILSRLGTRFMHHMGPVPTQDAAQPAADPGRIGQKLPDRWISSAREQPYIRPGLWTIFATTCRECPAGCGMHVRVREGRIIKSEGNPNHPVSHGGLCPRGQSAPQGLYDPDRVRGPLGRPAAAKSEIRDPKSETGGHRPLPWSQALAEVTDALRNARRLFIVSDLQTGTLAEIMQQFHSSLGLPGAVAFYEAFDYESLRAANQRLFGQAAIGLPNAKDRVWGPVPRYRLQDCDFILSFGAEFLETWISNVEFAWQFVQMHHRGPEYRGEMVYVGPTLSMTAANADHFVPIPAGQEYRVALAILREVVRLRGSSISDFGFWISDSNDAQGSNPQFQEVARRFASAKNAVALGGPVGAAGPAAENLATAVMLLNRAVGAVGKTVDFSQTHALSRTTPIAQLEQMLAELTPEDVLIVHQTNPAYSLPHLRAHLGRVGHLVYIGTMLNETARMAQWVLPTHSPLEAWGDYEPWTGIHCLMQPAMGALHDTRHSGDVFLALAEQYGRPLSKAGERLMSFRDWLRLNWRQLGRGTGTEFEAFWQQSLQRGGVFEEEKTGPMEHTRPIGELEIAVRPVGPISPIGLTEEASPEPMHLWLWPSIKLFDGRLANRGWMQEVPERMSTLTWGSWVDISPATAQRLKIVEGEAVEVSNESGRVTAPARITNEVADNVVALAFGQGHTDLGETANGRGVNAFVLRTRPAADSLFGTIKLRKTGERMPLTYLSATQEQHGRGIVQWTTPEDLRSMTKNHIEEIIWPGPRGYDPRRDLYTPHEYPEHRWAMVVDLDRCIGCGACEVACYAENNVPVVGPGPLGLGRTREMAWLRVPPYRHPEEPLRVGFLPLPCQHCDAAPCEPVCPVFAAVHNEQGLNAQIYNRCIGTRYCSNNCPYKVRRFNWFDPIWREPLHLQLNPDVMARCRGVMEKCTFCVQRIHYHERQAKVEGRPLREGEVQPACVQSCPTRAFVFGDLMQEGSAVSKLFEHPRRYQLLKELNTKPAVIYLKRIKPQRSEIT